MPPDTSHPTCPHGRNIRMCTDCQNRIIPPKVPIPRQPRALPSRASAEEPSSTKVQAKRGPTQQGHTEGDDLNMPPAKRSRKRRQNENGETVKNIKKEVWKYIDFTLSNLEKAKIPFACAVQVDAQILDHRQVARGRREFGLNQMERNQYRCSRPILHTIRFFKCTGDTERTELGCRHHRRNVELECPYCLQFSPCGLCHCSSPCRFWLKPEKVEKMRCMLCTKIQPPGPTCTGCGIRSAYYYCSMCKFWDDDSTKAEYHCWSCHICLLHPAIDKNMCMFCTPPSKIGTNKEQCSQRRSKAAIDTWPSMLDQWSSSVPLPKTIANPPYSMFDESTVPIAKPIIKDTKLALPLLPKPWTGLSVSSRPASAVTDRLKEPVVESSDSAIQGLPFLADPTISISMPSSTDDKKSESKDTGYDSHGTPDWENHIDWSQTASSHTIPPNRGQVNTHPIVHAPHEYIWGFPQGSPQSFRLPFLKSTSVFDDTMDSLSQSVAGMNMGVRSWK